MRSVYTYNQASSRPPPPPAPPTNKTPTPYPDIFNDNAINSNSSNGTEQTLLGPLAPILLSDDPTNPEELQNRFRIYSASLLGTSIFFWCWAMYNTQSLRRTSGGMDLGIISFFGTGVSSALLLRSSLGGKWRDKEQRFGCCGKKKEKREEDDLYLGSGGGGSNRRERDANAALSHAPPGTCLRGFALLTHVTVVANYLLGLLFALTAGSRIYYYFGTYCFTFSILWMVVAYAGWILVRVYRDAAAATYGKEILHNNGICASLWRELFATPMNYSRVGPGNNYNNQYYDEGEEEEEEEDEEIDEELRALYDGPKMGYSNA